MGLLKRLKDMMDNESPTEGAYVGKYTDMAVAHVKMLGVDMVNKANSGHPGIVLGAAPIVYALFRNHLVADPKHTSFFNRDRFVLSAGHGSALLYAMMHMAGYEDASMEELMKFRQIHSKTPGHPESMLTRGVDASTGPLGQGVAMGVGMALAESFLAAKYNVNTIKVVDHRTYVLMGDGCLEEGVTYESMALAGRYQLNKLIVLYDSNDVQLDGWVADSTQINVKEMVSSLGWDYIRVEKGGSVKEISEAIALAKKNGDKAQGKPTLIEVKTIIGAGSAKERTSEVHGAPIGAVDADNVRAKLGLKTAPFEVDAEAYGDLDPLRVRAELARNAYEKAVNDLKKADPVAHDEYTRIINPAVVVDEKIFAELETITKDATRNVAGKALDILSRHFPNMVGGSADLSGSTKIKGANGNFDYSRRMGRNVNYGVREFAMAAMNNGMALHGGIIPFGATFLAFLDYNKAAIRLAAIQDIRVLNFFSHDSVFVGEDGPTHQPIEQIWTSRLIPNTVTFRPANVEETVAALKHALESTNHPTTIITSRLPFDFTKSSVSQAARGGYVIRQSAVKPVLTLLATGSEVALAVQAAKDLEAAHPHSGVNVVSMPSVEVFEKQSEEYKQSVLMTHNVVSVEAGVTVPWAKYAKYNYGIDRFGMSGSPDQLRSEFKMNKLDLINYVQSKGLV